jgi:hypothetical protein
VKAVEKWIPCTTTFPSYQVCVSPFIAIKRVAGGRGARRGKFLTISWFKGTAYVEMSDRFQKRHRVNFNQIVEWSLAAEWRRVAKAKTAGTPAKVGDQPLRVGADEPSTPPPPGISPERQAWRLAGLERARRPSRSEVPQQGNGEGA